LQAKRTSLEERCLLLSVVSELRCSALVAPLLKKKNTSLLPEEVAVVELVVELAVVELAVDRIAEPVSSRPPARLPEREAELSATRMISPAYERDLGLRCP